MAAPVLPVLGALACFPVLGAAQTEEIMLLRAEVSSGSAPTAPGGEQEFSLVSEVRPGILSILRTRRTTLELLVEPRFYYRVPNVADLTRPLVLLSTGLRHDYALSERVTWMSLVDAQYGEVEYSSAELVLGSPLARPDAEAVILTLDAHAQSGFRWTATRRYALAMAAVASYTSSKAPEDREDLPTTTTVGGDVTQSVELDALSTLSFPATGRYYFVTTAPDWTAFTLSAAYRHTPNVRTTLEAAAGATLAWPAAGAVRAYPRAQLAAERVVHETRLARVVNRLALVLDTTFDPLLGELYPVVGAELSLTTTLGTRWSATVQGSAYTAATREPITPERLDTIVGANASVGYALSDTWALDFGARTNLRGPHLGESPFVFQENEVWGFVRIRGAIGTRPGGTD